MNIEEIKKAAEQFYSERNFSLAFKTILELGEDRCIDFLLGRGREWFKNETFVERVSSENQNLKCFFAWERSDELLFLFLSQKNVLSSVSFQSLIKKVCALNPKVLIQQIRVTQLFLKSPNNTFLLELLLSKEFGVHQQTWKLLSEYEFKLWQNVLSSIKELQSSEMELQEILCELVLWIEFKYCDFKSNEFQYELGHIYDVFVQVFFSKLDREKVLIIPTQENVKNTFCKRLQENTELIDSRLIICMDDITNWLNFYSSTIDPYCFDLTIQPVEENSVISFNRSAMDYYRWELDGKRYDINFKSYYVESRHQLNNEIKNKTFNYPRGSHIEFESECQIAYRSLKLYLDELNISIFPNQKKLAPERYFQPLIAGSKMFSWFYDRRIHINSPNRNEYCNTLLKEIERCPLHGGIDNFPFMYIEYEKLYQAHDVQSNIEGDTKTSKRILVDPFCYNVQFTEEINRFDLHYSVYKKPFLRLGNYIFCPALFFAHNDWFYSFANLCLERLSFKANSIQQMESSKAMEDILGDAFKELNYNVKVTTDQEANAINGDIDIVVSDNIDTLLLQLKRTKLRLNLRDAYSEKINIDRKASRQLNHAEKELSKIIKEPTVLNGNIHKWIVSTSYENALKEIDGCLKVNYSELILLLKRMALEKHTPPLSEIIKWLKSDYLVNLAIQSKILINPENFDLLTVQRNKKHFNPLPEAIHYHQLFSEVSLPLKLENPQVYRKNTLALDTRFKKVFEEYSSAINSHNGGDYKNAVKQFVLFLNKYPNDVEAMEALANSLADENRFKEAAVWFKKVSDLVPDDPYILRNYALCLMEFGQKEKAEEIFHQLRERYWYVDLKLFKSTEEITN